MLRCNSYGGGGVSSNLAYAKVTIDSDTNTLYLENDENYGNGGLLFTDPDNNNFYTDSLDGSKKGVASSFNKIVIDLDPNKAKDGQVIRGNDPFSFRLDATNTDLEIHVKESDRENFDAFHLTNHFPHLNIRNFTATVDSSNSDALNMSHDITTDSYVNVYGNLTATVSQGNGIRANASIKGNFTNTIDVYGTTNITITGSNIKNATSYWDVYYDPAAIYAGDSQYYVKILFFEKGAKTLGKGQITLHGDTILNLTGDNNLGILAGKNGSIYVNNLEITSTGKDSYGLIANNMNLTMNSYDMSENIHGSYIGMSGESNVIHMLGANSKALYASSEYGKIYSGENGEGSVGSLYFIGNVEADDKGTIDLTVRNNAKIHGQIKSQTSGTISLDVLGAVDFSAAKDETSGNSIAVVAGTSDWDVEDVDFAYPSDTNTVAITYGTGANGEVSQITGDIVSGFGGDISITQNVSKSRDASNSSLRIVGNALAGNGGKLNLSLGNGGYFEGRTDDYQDADNENWDHDVIASEFVNRIEASGTVNLDLGTNSTWNVTGQSWVSKIVANDSTIDLTNADTNHAIHIGQLEGANNTFVMNLSMDGSGNMLYVKEGASATQNIAINNRDEVLSSMKVGDRIRFATIANSQGGFNNAGIGEADVATFGRSARITDAGINNVDFDIVYEKYDSTDNDENNKYNNAGDSDGTSITETKPGSDYVDSIYGSGKNAQNAYLVRLAVPDEGGDEEVLSDAGRTIINMSRANYSNAVYMDTLNKRQGEARYGIGQDNGVWVRMRHDNIGKENSFRSNNTMFEIGYDIKNVVEGGQWRTGIALDYMNGQNDYHNVNGDGDIQRYGAWLYSTWFSDNGQYADFVLKYGHLKNDFDIYASTTGEKISGDYSNEVVSLSAEYGWKFANEKGWYVEPQAQLQYSYVSSADYTTSQNSKVELDSINSLIGRLGFRAGYDFATENPITAYVRGDVLHEFFGDQDISAFDNTGRLDTTYENDDTWYNVGVGLSVMTSQNTYFFIEGEQSFGADNEDTYTVSGGFRHNF